MGMFDYIRFEGEEYQTKDTPTQWLDHYEIRNGELWMKSVVWKYVEDINHFLGGYMEEESHQWIFCEDFDGVIEFYREDKENGGYKNGAWIEYKTLFMDGKMIKCVRKDGKDNI